MALRFIPAEHPPRTRGMPQHPVTVGRFSLVIGLGVDFLPPFSVSGWRLHAKTRVRGGERVSDAQ